MRLRKTEGTVKIADKSSKAVSVFKDMRLYNGYKIDTLKNGYAWIDLDSTKLIKLDSESRTVVQKNGKELDIILEKGRLYFNVAEPLAEDETMNIRTSTTAVGIRGTCGWIEVVGKNETKVSILEGSVQAAVINPATGDVKVESVSSGDTVICVAYDPAKPGDKCDIISGRFTEKDVPGFVAVDIVGDKALVEEIFEKSKTDVDLRRFTQSNAKERLKTEQPFTEQRAAYNEPLRNNEGDTPETLASPESSETPESPTTPESSSIPESSSMPESSAVPESSSMPESSSTPESSAVSESSSMPESSETPESSSMPESSAVPESSTTPESSSMPESPSTPESSAVSESSSMPESSETPAPEVYTVTFDSVGGSAVNAKNIASGSKVPKPANPAKDGYLFGGWYKEDTYANKWDFDNDTVAGNLTLYAKWGNNIAASGSAGSLTWTLDNIGTLVISGSGAMPDYSYYSHSPWYSQRNNIKNVVIEDGVTSIGGYAFSGCSSLASVTIPDSVTSIGEYAFYYCSNLASVTIGNSVKSIGNWAFYKCSSLASVTIGNSVKSIGYEAFSGCSSLASVTIPDSVTSIGNNAFSRCSSLMSVTIPDGVTSIRYSAFENCSSLASVTIGNSVTSIGERAFFDCSKLASVEIPSSVTSIGEDAFRFCSSLASVTIPDSVTSIGNYAFSGCSKLADVYFDGTRSQWDSKTWKTKFNGTTIHCTDDPEGSPVALSEEETALEEAVAEEAKNSAASSETEESSEVETQTQEPSESEESSVESTTEEPSESEESSVESTTEEPSESEESSVESTTEEPSMSEVETEAEELSEETIE